MSGASELILSRLDREHIRDQRQLSRALAAASILGDEINVNIMLLVINPKSKQSRRHASLKFSLSKVLCVGLLYALNHCNFLLPTFLRV